MFVPPTLWDVLPERSGVLPCRWLAWRLSSASREAEDIRALPLYPYSVNSWVNMRAEPSISFLVAVTAVTGTAVPDLEYATC